MPAQVREEHAANDFHSRRMPIPLPKKKPETMHQKAVPSLRNYLGTPPSAVLISCQLCPKVGVAPAVIPAEEGQSLNPEQKARLSASHHAATDVKMVHGCRVRHELAFEAVLTAAVDQQLEKERKERELDAAMLPVTHTLRELLGEELLALA
eukprot:4408649-Amphidinium_carterae.1